MVRRLLILALLFSVASDLSAARARALVRNPLEALIAVDAQIYDVAVDKAGSLWFSAPSSVDGPFIGRLEADGSVRRFSRFPMINPGRLAFSGDGSVWFGEQFTLNPLLQYVALDEPVVDKASGYIGVVRPSGEVTHYLVRQGSLVLDVAPGPDGNIWFTEFIGDRIGRITPDGAVTEFPLPPSLSLPWGITAGPDGALWFTTRTTGNHIGRISVSGEISEFDVPQLGAYPTGSLAYVTTGTDALYFSMGSSIGRLTTSGQFSVATPPGGLMLDITAGPNGDIYAIVFSNGGKMGLDDFGVLKISSDQVVSYLVLPREVAGNDEFPLFSNRPTAIGVGLPFEVWIGSAQGIVTFGSHLERIRF